MINDPQVREEMCELQHRRYQVLVDGEWTLPRCPECLAIGLDHARAIMLPNYPSEDAALVVHDIIAERWPDTKYPMMVVVDALKAYLAAERKKAEVDT